MSTPEQVVFHGTSGALELRWEDGGQARLEGPRLRAACKCAACEAQRRQGLAVAGGTALLLSLQAVGEHGLAMVFSDGHDRGIYPWAYLRQLADGAPTADAGTPASQPL